MAGYRATVKYKCWKQHTCSGCGCVYRYLMERQGTGQGGTREAAGAAADAQGIKALTTQVDQQPCPHCGIHQPDMVGASRGKVHQGLWWLALVGLPVAFFIGNAISDFSLWPWLGAGFALLLLVFHTLSARRNP